MTRQRIDASADKYLAAYLIKCIENLGFTSWMAHAPPMPASHVDFVLNDSDLASRSTLRNVYQHMCMRWGSCEHQCPWPDATIARNEETHMTLPTNEAFSGSWTCSSLSRSASRDFATCRQPEQWNVRQETSRLTWLRPLEGCWHLRTLASKSGVCSSEAGQRQQQRERQDKPEEHMVAV